MVFTMPIEVDPSSLLLALYDAESDNRGWSHFLKCCCDSLDAAGAVVEVNGTLAGTYRIDEAYVAKYGGHYGAKNIYIQRCGDILRAGTVVLGEGLCPNSELEKSEYYNDYLAPQDVYHSVAAVIEKKSDRLIHVGFVRPKRAAAFGVSEVEFLQFLAPHLQLAMQVRKRLQNLEGAKAAMLEALDYLPFGVFLLDASGRVIESNNKADAMSKPRDGFYISNRQLIAMRSDENIRLKNSIRDAVGVYTGAGVKAASVVRLSRPSGRRPFILCVAPLRVSIPARLASRIVAAVFVSDPNSESKPDSALWRACFAFTPAEIRLASLLLAGKTVKEASDLLQVTTNTTRTQLKSIMSKTGTCRQSELVRVLLATLVYIPVGRGEAPSGAGTLGRMSR